MATDTSRNDQSPQDPRFRVPANAPRTDYDRSGEGAEARRRAAQPTVPADTKIVRNSLGGLMENGIDVQPTEVAALSYSCGIPQELARRIVSQARRIEALEQTKNTLLNSVTELLNAFGEHEIQLAELRQVLVSLQAKKK